MIATQEDWRSLLSEWEAFALPVLRDLKFRDDIEDVAVERGSLVFPPASEPQISAAEMKLAIRLPEEVRNFFKTSNGFLAGLRASRISPVEEIGYFKDKDPLIHELWSRPKRAKDLPGWALSIAPERLRTAIQITPQSDDGASWLLIPTVVSTGGEWQTVDFSPRRVNPIVYESFYEAMRRDLDAAHKGLDEILKLGGGLQ